MFRANSYEDRLLNWKKFRDYLNLCSDPIDQCFKYFNLLELESLQYDPWSTATYPDPWMLIDKNKYCAFSQILMICYSLQLTNIYSTKDFTLLIYQNHISNIVEYGFEVESDQYFDPQKNTNDITIMNKVQIPKIR